MIQDEADGILEYGTMSWIPGKEFTVGDKIEEKKKCFFNQDNIKGFKKVIAFSGTASKNTLRAYQKLGYGNSWSYNLPHLNNSDPKFNQQEYYKNEKEQQDRVIQILK